MTIEGHLSAFEPSISLEALAGSVEAIVPSDDNILLDPGWIVMTGAAVYIATQPAMQPDGPIEQVHRIPLSNLRVWMYDTQDDSVVVGLFHIPDDQLESVDSSPDEGKYIALLAKQDRHRSRTAEVLSDDKAKWGQLYEQAMQFSRHVRALGTDPESGLGVFASEGGDRTYLHLGQSDFESWGRKHTAPVFSRMSLEDITLDHALRLLGLPRVVGGHPDDGAPVEALNGRFGPHIKWAGESRSLESEKQLFAITLDEALILLKQSPQRRRVRTTLRDLGLDPLTGRRILLRQGRFGPFITDGETNASLPETDTIDDLTLEDASDKLAAKRISA